MISSINGRFRLGETQTPRQTAPVQALRSTRFVEVVAHRRKYPTISADDLTHASVPRLAPALVDVRRRGHSGFDDRLIVGAIHHDPNTRDDGSNSPGRSAVVVYCSDGCDVSRGATRAAKCRYRGRPSRRALLAGETGASRHGGS